MVQAVLLLRLYPEECRFTVITDHDELKWILNLSNSTDKLAQWQLCLSEFEFDIVHRVGIMRQAGDVLSRLKKTEEDESLWKTRSRNCALRHPTPRTRRGEGYIHA